jgi:hypothetical protein
VSGAIIAITNLMVLARVLVIGAVVAPGAITVMPPVLGGGLAISVAVFLFGLQSAEDGGNGRGVPLRYSNSSRLTRLCGKIGFHSFRSSASPGFQTFSRKRRIISSR